MSRRHLKLCDGWSVTGRYGVYYSSFQPTRKEAIDEHCRKLGVTWAYCRKVRKDDVIRAAIFSVKP